MNRAHEGLPSEPFPAAPKPSNSPAGEPVQKGVVPDVSGMVLSRAQATIESAGYRAEVRNEPSSDVDQWYVIGTDPAPGTRLPENETVVIRQSSGEG